MAGAGGRCPADTPPYRRRPAGVLGHVATGRLPAGVLWPGTAGTDGSGRVVENLNQKAGGACGRGKDRGSLFGGAFPNKDHAAAVLAALVSLDMNALPPQDRCRLS